MHIRKYQKNTLYLGLFAALGLSLQACQMTDAMNSVTTMDGKMDGVYHETKNANVNTDSMKSSIHKQTLGVALDEMLKPENTKYISPDSTTPTAIMPAGKIFAEEATAEEIAELTETMMKDIASAQPTDAEKASTPKDVLEKQYDKDKWAKFTILQVIAGLAPQATIEKMVQEQITNGGVYEDSAYTVLCLRHMFVNDYLLGEQLMSKPMTNPGKYEEALKDAGYLNYIEKLPFKASIQVKLIGMVNTDYNVTIDLKDADVSKTYQKIAVRMKQELQDKYKNSKDGAVRARISTIQNQLNMGSSGH